MQYRMDLPDPSLVAKLRKKQKLTQSELARKAGVSQSLIARLEAGSIDPRYSKVARIFNALSKEASNEPTVEKVMSTKVLGVQPDQRIGYAVKKMGEYKVSQLPVYQGKDIIGSISEKTISNAIAHGTDTRDLSRGNVYDYMEETFPTVSPYTPLSVASKLLEHNPAVIVVEKGRVKGIVTKADLLKTIHK